MANFFSTCEKVRNLNLIKKTPIKNKTSGQTHPSQLRCIIYQKADGAPGRGTCMYDL